LIGEVADGFCLAIVIQKIGHMFVICLPLIDSCTCSSNFSAAAENCCLYVFDERLISADDERCSTHRSAVQHRSRGRDLRNRNAFVS
jgi:hypothetical protein